MLVNQQVKVHNLIWSSVLYRFRIEQMFLACGKKATLKRYSHHRVFGCA